MNPSDLPPAVTDETRVPAFTLPPVLEDAPDNNASTPQWFEQEGRPQLLENLRRYVYGRTPEGAVRIESRTTLDDVLIEGATVRMREVELTLSRGSRTHRISVLLFFPENATAAVPVFLGLNFVGNHAVHPDPRIAIHESWIRNDQRFGITDNRATASSRGCKAYRWPVAEMARRGYALATVYYGDIDPDFHDGFENGVHALFPESAGTNHGDDDWGTIGAWAWGLSRLLDFLQSEPRVDATRAAVIGHSRLGKTALWAGAQDPRFALVISNASGCGGAALSRRRYGERLIHINTNFPHWFCRNFQAFNEREHELPVDQHQLMAAIAPRPIGVGSAVEDTWCDPYGELLSLWHADPAFRLFGLQSLPHADFPTPGSRIEGFNQYHLRSGDHDLLAEDWAAYLDLADRRLH